MNTEDKGIRALLIAWIIEIPLTIYLCYLVKNYGIMAMFGVFIIAPIILTMPIYLFICLITGSFKEENK